MPLLANGVRKPIMKFPSQLQAVAREPCFARVRRGNVSPMTTHANGPQVIAKEAMNMQADTIMTTPELPYCVGGRATPTDANIRSQADCQRAPTISGTRR